MTTSPRWTRHWPLRGVSASNRWISGWRPAGGWQVCCAAKPRPRSGEAVPIDRFAHNPTAHFSEHVTRAIAAAIFDDPAALTNHTRAAMQSIDLVSGNYATAIGRVLRGLALAEDARTAAADERAALFAVLEEVIRWLSARAADAPDNFGHLLRLLEAERAWAAGDFGAAATGVRRGTRRGCRASAPVASGADHRARGPVCPGAGLATHRL